MIERLEQEIAYLQEQIAVPEFYDQPFEITSEVLSDLSSKQDQLDHSMQRWAELEGM